MKDNDSASLGLSLAFAAAFFVAVYAFSYLETWLTGGDPKTVMIINLWLMFAGHLYNTLISQQTDSGKDLKERLRRNIDMIARIQGNEDIKG